MHASHLILENNTVGVTMSYLVSVFDVATVALDDGTEQTDVAPPSSTSSHCSRSNGQRDKNRWRHNDVVDVLQQKPESPKWDERLKRLIKGT